MPDRPLLILPALGKPLKRNKKSPGFPKIKLPDRDRQAVRIEPRFTVLQQVIEARRTRLQTETAGLAPEEVIVLETIGTVDDFVVAVRNIDGLEWLGEIEEEDIPPDDDFFELNKKDERKEKSLKGRIFLIFTNQSALQQLLSLWNTWKTDQPLPKNLRKWGVLFSSL